jgi:glycosyltransferase involved in cell wall biosynthesis
MYRFRTRIPVGIKRLDSAYRRRLPSRTPPSEVSLPVRSTVRPRPPDRLTDPQTDRQDPDRHVSSAVTPEQAKRPPPGGFKVAYLVNQYPHVSHSFIRREIVALEARGFTIERFSIRPSPLDLVDPADRAEQQKTHVLLAAGRLGLLTALLGAAARAPTAFVVTLRAAVRLGRRSDRGILRHMAYVAEASVLLQELRRRGDVAHLHAHFGTNSAAVALFARLLGGPRYSFTVHGPEEFDHPIELSLPEKIAHASAVIAVSDFGRSQLYRWIPYAEWPKVEVVRCGVDAAFLAAGPQPIVDNRRMLCIGRLSEQKGQLLILEALAGLAAQGIDVEMVLAGDGPMRPTVERRVRELGLEASVRITGWVSNDDVRKELLAARILLLPSFAEGLPVALMEALALGRPAISTYVAGIPELLQNRINGWLIPAGSIDALKAAIRQALETPVAELATMGRAGAAAVAERHDANREAGRLALLFDRPAIPPAR